ncbi:MAG: hypothetical protein Q8K72_11815, partial [Acidimicrobiales bacterium]|nr:hypothetical protein [Acidimicrobiales bacterium]
MQLVEHPAGTRIAERPAVLVVDEEGGPLLRDSGARRILDELHDKGLNFELADHRGEGWLADDYCQP